MDNDRGLSGFASLPGVQVGKTGGALAWPWAIASFMFSYFALIAFALTRKGLPTVSEYARKYPACVTERGMSCYRCGSRSIRLWREQPFIAAHQWHICNSCGTSLYRSR
ncbi:MULTISPECIES: hypothetical protein [Cupriavidus]|uniref:GATA-type domain-containing protein n=2 Tax=Cupriavidus TaxID=106589 RepID=A0A375HWU2_9BURK|nr:MULTISPECIES: hypothetical protein [Cupriavidus]MCO4865671.1 hypothetical protein [Cupriavidus sp. WGlv3]MCO4893431.1 hypothetical protein [Cupriavidus sp. WGtm5]SOY74201.1 hypothetical protein CBM2588_P110002 [Cupriavidus taiwanensis]SOY74208.1 hypothetical protein CBM2592_P130002 [Cupriavidus taiwanensis]SOY74280.1 hypothetical protein CBM2585_P100002 [Cupriavidus taiwanensis]